MKEVNTAQGTKFAVDHTCSNDLPAKIPADQQILSTFPDANGLLWFTTSGGTDPTKEPAMVGTLKPDSTDAASCAVSLYTLPEGESIAKSFAVDPDPSAGGVFIVSTYRLYRFRCGRQRNSDDYLAGNLRSRLWHQARAKGPGLRNHAYSDGKEIRYDRR